MTSKMLGVGLSAVTILFCVINAIHYWGEDAFFGWLCASIVGADCVFVKVKSNFGEPRC